ncbi:MAG TPA: roadblock/LC7 domain-containing protein [Thermomicrobiales bacterium]|nr:roadblock/LC7 domain-containing protein [Thermomicrobiales bacterium]
MTLAGALQELHGSNELKMAAVVSADGLVIESCSSPDVDAESICSVASNGLLIMDAMAQELDEGSAELITLEYGNHLLMLAPLDDENLLVLLAGAGMNLGRLRIILRRNVPLLTEALGSV